MRFNQDFINDGKHSHKVKVPAQVYVICVESPSHLLSEHMQHIKSHQFLIFNRNLCAFITIHLLLYLTVPMDYCNARVAKSRNVKIEKVE